MMIVLRSLRCAVLVMAVVAAVLGMRAAGLLQGLELALYYQWIRYASKDGATSSRIAIVARSATSWR